VAGSPTTTCALTGPLPSGGELALDLSWIGSPLFTGTVTDTGTVTLNTPANTGSPTSASSGLRLRCRPGDVLTPCWEFGWGE
jgi:hypothetical protein